MVLSGTAVNLSFLFLVSKDHNEVLRRWSLLFVIEFNISMGICLCGGFQGSDHGVTVGTHGL
jgi:hypothetical protein